MKYILALAFLAGCGGSLADQIPLAPDAGIAATDPYHCHLSATDNGCHCVIPENSAEALAAMQERCDLLRELQASLY